MLDNLFSTGLSLFAFVLPISIGRGQYCFFFRLRPCGSVEPIGRWPRWAPVWGWPEKLFGLYLAVSLLSAFAGIDVAHSVREIKNKDFYILIAIVLIAFVRTRENQKRLIHLFMWGGLLTAIIGLLQWTIGVNQTINLTAYSFICRVPWPTGLVRSSITCLF
jgi:hypothetical protein